ncbi:MAG: hypothetical protein K9H25_04190 [Rhodospirillum sp.]|nr:hypothetical protein [Rhodospirillum sp.]MCF8488873.1 hypothetical protein [Rhodospirillum sp.]MCF8502753.1 hypothetical protein [Rhodospirillum sp.]
MTPPPPLPRRDLLRGGLSRALEVVQEPLAALEDIGEDSDRDTGSASGSEADSMDVFFGSFENCHTLLAEIRPLLAEEVARLGIDPRGRDPIDLAREIFSRQERPPVPAREPAPPPASPVKEDPIG